MEKESSLEKVSSSLPTKISTAALAAFSGNPLAVFLPLLTETLAGSRHKERVEKALSEIEKILRDHDTKLQDLSDSQYKIISEAILAVFQTIEEQKLEYLRCAIKNSINKSNQTAFDADRISRIIRDISADEVKFLFKYQSYDFFYVGYDSKSELKTKSFEPGSKEAKIIDGLNSLGLLLMGGETWNELFHFKFSPIVPAVTKLLQ